MPFLATTKTVHLLGIALLAVASAVTCNAQVDPSQPLTSEQWLEDLRYLARELPRRHVNPFRTHDEAEFRRAVAKLEGDIETLQDHQIQVEMGRLVAMIGDGDGHTELYLPREGRRFRQLPFAVAYFHDELRVFAATADHEELNGARVVSIGGTPVAEAHERVLPLIAHDNEAEFKLTAPAYLVIPEILHGVGLIDSPDRAAIGFEFADGREATLTLDAASLPELGEIEWKRARPADSTPLYAQHPDENYWFEYLEHDRTLYVSYRRCSDQKGRPSIKRFARELFKFVDSHEVDRFVLDMRANRGGNYNRSDPIVKGLRDREKINRPGVLYAIVGRETFSAAVVTAIRLKRETAASLVGESPRSRPNGSDNYEWMHLPNSGIRVDYSDRLRDHWPELGDAPQIPLDIFVESSFDEYRQGRDAVLESIRELPR